MKIVIDLPQKVIDRLRSNYGHGVKCFLGDNDKDTVVDAIYNCIYLPERHGDLIDRDEIEFSCKEGLCPPGFGGSFKHAARTCNECIYAEAYIEQIARLPAIIKSEGKQEKPGKLKYVGYSSHDDESRYQCPICKEGYGSWDFINGSVRMTNGLFRCKCGKLLKKPE